MVFSLPVCGRRVSVVSPLSISIAFFEREYDSKVLSLRDIGQGVRYRVALALCV